MCNNLFSINFNLGQICRELKRRNIRFSTNGKLIAILPINIHITEEKYVAVYQNHNTPKRIQNPNLSKAILSVIKLNSSIKTEVYKETLSIVDIQMIISKHDIVCLQNGRIL